MFDLGNQPIIRRIPGLNPTFQQVTVFLRDQIEPMLQRIVTPQIQINDIELRRLIFMKRRPGLQQQGRDMAAFGQKEPANLCDMRPSGQMDVIPLTIFIETIATGKVKKLGLGLLKIPRITEIKPVEYHFGVRASRFDLTLYRMRQTVELKIIKQLEPIHMKFVMFDE